MRKVGHPPGRASQEEWAIPGLIPRRQSAGVSLASSVAHNSGDSKVCVPGRCRCGLGCGRDARKLGKGLGG